MNYITPLVIYGYFRPNKNKVKDVELLTDVINMYRMHLHRFIYSCLFIFYGNSDFQNVLLMKQNYCFACMSLIRQVI